MLKELLIGTVILCSFLWLRRLRWKRLDEELRHSIATDNDFKQRLGDNTLYHMTVPSITRLRLVEKAKTLMLERMEERIPLHFEEDRVPRVRIW